MARRGREVASHPLDHLSRARSPARRTPRISADATHESFRQMDRGCRLRNPRPHAPHPANGCLMGGRRLFNIATVVSGTLSIAAPVTAGLLINLWSFESLEI